MSKAWCFLFLQCIIAIMINSRPVTGFPLESVTPTTCCVTGFPLESREKSKCVFTIFLVSTLSGIPLILIE